MKISAFSTLRDLIEPDFPCQHIETLSDRSGRLGEELAYLVQWLYPDDPADMDATTYSAIQHLMRTRHQLILDVKDSDLDHFAIWGRKSNSIFALPDETLRDPDGALLAAKDVGATSESIPFGAVPYPQDAVERSLRNRELLQKKSITITPDLPPILGAGEVVGKSADEVAWRALSLFIVAVRAESISTKQVIPVDKLQAKSPMAFESLTGNEQQFMNDPDPDPQVVASFAWQYESLYALQWALGMHDQMSFPDDICDVPRVAEAMVDQADRELVVNSRLRPIDELLDATDLNYQMLWAARQARIDDQDPPSGIDGGVLVQRQHALNWVIQFNESTWDDMDTPT